MDVAFFNLNMAYPAAEQIEKFFPRNSAILRMADVVKAQAQELVCIAADHFAKGVVDA